MECILTNEKYKGDAILRKTYCTDYIQKTFVVNDGSEIPKYYAQNSHPAIVSAEVFDLTQMELEWRRSLKGSYSGKSCFASRIVCGDGGISSPAEILNWMQFTATFPPSPGRTGCEPETQARRSACACPCSRKR